MDFTLIKYQELLTALKQHKHHRKSMFHVSIDFLFQMQIILSVIQLRDYNKILKRRGEQDKSIFDEAFL